MVDQPIPIAPLDPAAVATPVATPTTPTTPATPVPAKDMKITFPQAIRAIMDGKKVRRLSWKNVDEYCVLMDEWLKIFIRNEFHTWQVSQGDMEGDDWVII